MRKLAFAGAGFVGAVYGAVLAKQGNKVTLYDVNKEKINHFNNFCDGKTDSLPIYEEGLGDILRKTYKEKRLSFTTDDKQAISDAEVIFLAVGTPSDMEGRADMRYFDGAVQTIAEVLHGDPTYKVIVTKSTVPVGTARCLEGILRASAVGEFDIASNPETLAEGSAVEDALKPTRIIVGTESERAKKLFSELYAPFFEPQRQHIHFMSWESAELVKYACNTYLASQVALTNAFGNLAKKKGANFREMIPAILADPRIGKFVNPGLGFGGSCFDKDVSALIAMMKDTRSPIPDINFLDDLLAQNTNQKHALNPLLENIYPKGLYDKTFAVWGLAFKKDTNDVRDAASLKVIPDLLQRGARVRAYDPQAQSEFIRMIDGLGTDTTNLSYSSDMYEATNGADGLLIITEWKIFRQPDFAELRKRMRKPIIFDAKDLLEYQRVKEEKDFSFYFIARPDIVR